MNFGMILLCLLIGCVIGFEFGKYIMGKKIAELLSKTAENMKKEAEEAQKKRDNLKAKWDEAFMKVLDSIASEREPTMAEEKEHADRIAGDTDGDEPVRPVFLNHDESKGEK